MTVGRFEKLVLGAGLTGTDNLDGSIEVTADADLVGGWFGPLPSLTGAGLVCRVPYAGAAAATFNLTRIFTRLEQLPSGDVTFRLEKSAGGNSAFAAVSVGSLTHNSSQYERENAALSATVTSGDLLRIYFVAVANGNGGAYELQVQGVQQ
jgi:hypothetical protein